MHAFACHATHMITYEPMAEDATDVILTVNMTERGRNGGKARAKKMSAAARKASAAKAARGRWAKYYRENPERKKKAKRKAKE